MQRGSVFEAMLAHFAIGISAGDSDALWITSVKQKLSTDNATMTLFASLQPRSKQAAKDTVKSIEAIADPKLTYGYVLDVFKGNILAQLGDTAAAEQSFLTALRANPDLTGTWHDLGTNYYRQFRIPEAWQCWDIARRMRPDHPFMKSVNEQEQQLTAAHPEFF